MARKARDLGDMVKIAEGSIGRMAKQVQKLDNGISDVRSALGMAKGGTIRNAGPRPVVRRQGGGRVQVRRRR